MELTRGLYIHIPFCTSFCAYCDYCKLLYNEEFASQYLEALQRELDSYNIDKIATLYLGGGTPSALSYPQLKRLFDIVKPYVYEGLSFTMECNVENLDEAKIALMAESGVNRVSLGIQSFSKAILNTIKRNHDLKKVQEVISLLRKYNIKDINGDLIYGLPYQDLKTLNQDLSMLTSLPLTHVSTYLLGIHPHTLFFNQNVKEIDDDLARTYYDLIVNYLHEKGYERYEVSNFAQKGYQSKHNLIYWRNEEYYGVGLGASGYVDGKRYTNTRNFFKYCQDQYQLEEEILNKEDQEFYEIMLALRLEEGLDLNKFQDKYHQNFIDKYREKIELLQKESLIEYSDINLKVKKENFFILDYVLRRLLF